MKMRSFSIRVFIVFLITVLIMASSMVIRTQPKETVDYEDVEDEIYTASDQDMSRPTRAGEPWPMYLNNPKHTSYTTSFGPTINEYSWYSSTGGSTYSSPCLADGRVFIGADEAMNCYYENNGTLAWRTYTIEPVTGTFGVCSSPAYSDGYIYFGGDRIYCLYANNGTIKWRVDDPGNYKHGDGSPTVANGKVFIGGSDRKLYCIDQYTGEVLWKFQTLSSGLDNWGLYAAPAYSNGHVYLSACDGYLYQIKENQPTATATANNTFDMAYASYFSPLIVNDRIYVGCGYDTAKDVNRLYCLYESNLTKIWEFYPGYPVSFFCSAGYYNGRIYVGSISDSNSGNLFCLDATGGGGVTTVIWQYNIHSTWSSPAVTNNRLYIGSKDNFIYCFNLTQTPGLEDYLWRFDTQGDVDATAAISNGRAFVGTHGNGGRLYCFGSYVEPPPGSYTILKKGWNLVSVPWVQTDQDLNDVLGSISGSYDAVQWLDLNKDWKHYKKGEPYGNDLNLINEKMGFWIHITQSGDTIFYYNGTEPTENQIITLYPGWNMVGYPSLSSHDRTKGLNNLTFDVDVNAIWTYNATAQKWIGLGPSDHFEPGRGYYIHAISKCEWEVPL
ncbi:MAG: PQQ-like beta-propeller repeat protein [Thermoplasmata archaeon]|nr:MAG: PQQ-like beta-propeller repeat protein [Thermoplasmata archaeon]